MPKKSHRIASKQAEISRERKRKKRAQVAQRQPVVPRPAAPAIEPPVSEPATTAETTSVTITQPPPSVRPAASRYQYVTAEIRKIAIIGAVMVAILIVLAFVLG